MDAIRKLWARIRTYWSKFTGAKVTHKRKHHYRKAAQYARR